MELLLAVVSEQELEEWTVVRRQLLCGRQPTLHQALAQGQTIREAAAKLYLSPKTVEYQLRNVYGKLEIRLREELRAVMGGPAG